MFKRAKSDGLSLTAAASAAPRRAAARAGRGKAGRSAKICLGGASRAWDVASHAAVSPRRIMVTRVPLIYHTTPLRRAETLRSIRQEFAKIMASGVKILRKMGREDEHSVVAGDELLNAPGKWHLSLT